MIDMHIHIRLDKDTDVAAEGAKLKELLNAALVGEVGEVNHVCNCRPALPTEEEENPNQVTPAEIFETDAPAAIKEATEEASEETPAEPKKKAKSAKKVTAPEIKIEDVRAVLSEYKAKGGDLKAILKPYGANLPAVKKEDYAALLRDAKEALSKLEEE